MTVDEPNHVKPSRCAAVIHGVSHLCIGSPFTSDVDSVNLSGGAIGR